ncbi:MAG: hypothetical protein V4504_01935 [Patescibacteria group bacterium]
MKPEEEKLHRLEDMKSRLFSKSYESLQRKRFGILHKKEYQVNEDWEDDTKQETMSKKFFMKTSLFQKFFIFSIGFFVLAVIFALYSFLFGGNTVSNDNIEIAVLGNTFTAGGEELPLQIEITNKNNTALELADLVLEYPKGSSTDLKEEVERLRDSLGTIPAGQVRTDNIKVTLFGEQGSIKPIKISLEYRVEGSNSIFVKEKDYSVTVSSAPIDLSIQAPNTATPNQDITFNLKATLNATKPASGLVIKADYPIGFVFKSSTPSPSINNNVWDLGDMSPGAVQDITIVGTMTGVEDGEDKTFHFFAGSQSTSDKGVIGVIFNSIGHTISVQKPFIQARLLVNGEYKSEYSTDSKNNTSVQIQWANNLPTNVNDVEIRAKISGNAYDRKKIFVSNGFYSSTEDTIIWDKNSSSQFAEITPGETGQVGFSFAPSALFSSNGLIPDPYVQIDISIVGKQALDNDAVQTVTDTESKKIRVTSDTGFSSKVFHLSGPIVNTGPIPPKAETETTYSVSWNLSNTVNAISGAKITAQLPPYVKFTGTTSPTSEDIKYDPISRKVTWNIGSIPKGTGITGASKEVYFQIAITPSLSQLGTLPILVGEAVLTGHDDFANVEMRVSKAALNTRLTGDANPVLGSEKVTE